MDVVQINPSTHLSGTPVIPGDKSISHRGLIFGALAEGDTKITHLLESEDVQSTARCLMQMGVQISKTDGLTIVKGVGAKGFTEPKEVLDCGNSGTTVRLLMGLLSGMPFTSRLAGDASLSKRPMKRVAEPLRKMGATIKLKDDNLLPGEITGGELHSTSYELKVASAQIKTAIMLAGLLAKGETKITGEIKSRDHTERLLQYFGVKLSVREAEIKIAGGQRLKGRTLAVPGDPSTAAFWIGAASMIPGAHVTMRNVSLNPTRTGFIEFLRKMGANIKTTITSEQPERIGIIEVKGAKLKGGLVTAEMVPSLIDEIPLLAVVAARAHGKTEVRGAEELRVKESDRLEAVAKNLRAMGIEITIKKDGFVIEGPQNFKGAKIETFHDHRIAMAFSIAGLVAKGTTEIHGASCVGISYPEFFDTLKNLTKG